MSSLIAYRTQTLGPPITEGSPYHQSSGDHRAPYPRWYGGLGSPYITRNMGTGVPKLGGPHFTQTPDFVFGTESLGSRLYLASFPGLWLQFLIAHLHQDRTELSTTCCMGAMENNPASLYGSVNLSILLFLYPPEAVSVSPVVQSTE